MAGKLLNSCYFYVVLAHIPAGGLCTNQGASAAPPVWFGGIRLYITPLFQSLLLGKAGSYSSFWEQEYKSSRDPDVLPQKRSEKHKAPVCGVFIPSVSPGTCLRRCHRLKHSPHHISPTKPWDLAISWMMKVVLCRWSLCVY